MLRRSGKDGKKVGRCHCHNLMTYQRMLCEMSNNRPKLAVLFIFILKIILVRI